MPITRRDFLKATLAGGAALASGLGGLPGVAAQSGGTVQITPYDSKVGIWHWEGSWLTQNSIAEVATTVKSFAPRVSAIFVKTSDGSRWQGEFDTKPALAIDGPESIANWVNTLAQHDLEVHAWCVPKGTSVEGETDLIIEACQVEGVRSMLLDIEPFSGFWQGDETTIRSFMSRIRAALPDDFHIGMAVDPRGQRYSAIFPETWYPYIDSVHPFNYWATFQRTPEDVFDETYDVWGDYGKPLIPVLQVGHDPADAEAAVTYATDTYLATSLSWWRLQDITPTHWGLINESVAAVERQFG